MPDRTLVADALADYDSACEIGVGRRPTVAATLAERGLSVVATDVRPRAVPEGVQFVRDDLVAAAERARRDDDPGAPYHADVLYALHCPPELHRPLATVAAATGADAAFTTLGGDPPTVPVTPAPLPGGATLYHVDDA